MLVVYFLTKKSNLTNQTNQLSKKTNTYTEKYSLNIDLKLNERLTASLVAKGNAQVAKNGTRSQRNVLYEYYLITLFDSLKLRQRC